MPPTTTELMPAGHYLARGVTAILAETKGGEPQVAVTLVILEEGPWANTQMPWYGLLGSNIKEEQKRRAIESLRTLGWDGDDLSNIAGIDRNDVSVEIAHEEYPAGKWSARVKWINKPGAIGVAKPMDPNKAKAFAASVKGLIMSVKQSAPPANSAPVRAPAPRPSAQAPAPRQPQAQTQTQQQAMQLTDADIPF